MLFVNIAGEQCKLKGEVFHIYVVRYCSRCKRVIRNSKTLLANLVDAAIPVWH